MRAALRPDLLERAELALPPMLLLCVAEALEAHPTCTPTERGLCADILPWLRMATAEAFEGIPFLKAKRMAKEIGSIAGHVVDAGEPAVLFLGTSQWILGLLNSGILMMGAGSAMDVATTRLFDALTSKEWDEEQRAAADMLAGLIGERFKALGLFAAAQGAAA